MHEGNAQVNKITNKISNVLAKIEQHLQYYNSTQSTNITTTRGALGQVMKITVHQTKQPMFQVDKLLFRGKKTNHLLCEHEIVKHCDSAPLNEAL